WSAASRVRCTSLKPRPRLWKMSDRVCPECTRTFFQGVGLVFSDCGDSAGSDNGITVCGGGGATRFMALAQPGMATADSKVIRATVAARIQRSRCQWMACGAASSALANDQCEQCL